MALARLLLVLHAVVGAACVASATHALIWLGLRRPRFRALLRVATGLTALQLVLGLVLYPVYRVAVRAAVFDRPLADGTRPLAWLGHLFDLKEHGAAFALLALAAALWLARAPASRQPGLTRTVLLAALSFGVGLLWFAALVGLLVTSYRGLGG